jgi:hypothetical protein
LEETASHIVKSATGGIVEQGVMGSFVILFFIIAAVLLWVILKDKDYQKKMADALTDMVDNQKSFNEQYRTSQEHHKEVVALIIDDRKIERTNTKECYGKVENRLVYHEKKLDDILTAVGA